MAHKSNSSYYRDAGISSVTFEGHAIRTLHANSDLLFHPDVVSVCLGILTLIPSSSAS
jgi:hypothetical protein